MLWIGIGVALVAAGIVAALFLGKRPIDDLGSVSDHWIADHRVDSP
jgi:hypothetical protein